MASLGHNELKHTTNTPVHVVWEYRRKRTALQWHSSLASYIMTSQHHSRYLLDVSGSVMIKSVMAWSKAPSLSFWFQFVTPGWVILYDNSLSSSARRSWSERIRSNEIHADAGDDNTWRPQLAYKISKQNWVDLDLYKMLVILGKSPMWHVTWQPLQRILSS